MAKRNWDLIKDQQPKDTMKNRDVYEDQQLERGHLQAKQTKTSRLIFCIIVTLIAGFAAYLIACALAPGISRLFGTSGSVVSDTGDVGSDTEIEEVTTESALYEVQEVEFLSTYAVVSKETGDVIDTWHLTDGGVENIYVCDEHPDVSLAEVNGSPEATIAAVYDMHTGKYIGQSSSETGVSGSDDVTTESDVTSDLSKIGISFKPTFGKVLFALICASIVFALMYTAMMRNLEAQNMLSDTSDINQYQNDQHIALPEEVQRKFDWFPDVGATSDVQFSSMISHMAISNKGLKKVRLSRRADKDILDADGDIEYYKGEVLLDEDGNPLYDEVPIIDTKFMDDLFQASGMPKDKAIRKYYDTTLIPYNPDGSDREKLGKFATVADLINADWEFPYYEPQRPAGAYIVDTAPVNTMVLAIK